MTPGMTRALVESILRHPRDHNWSIQGLGMLRTYLGDNNEYRLHVWDSEHATPHVSRLHTHPWNFESYIVAGSLLNQRYRICASEDIDPDDPPNGVAGWHRVKISCGINGGMVEQDPDSTWLMRGKPEVIIGGQWYAQQAFEIHDTIPKDGTVTIIKRVIMPDPDHALVYVPVGDTFVSCGGAVTASGADVINICDKALRLWF